MIHGHFQVTDESMTLQRNGDTTSQKIQYKLIFFDKRFWYNQNVLGSKISSIDLFCLLLFFFSPLGVYILIAVGAVMMFVGFLGCYGAIQESQCLLGTVSHSLTSHVPNSYSFIQSFDSLIIKIKLDFKNVL